MQTTFITEKNTNGNWSRQKCVGEIGVMLDGNRKRRVFQIKDTNGNTVLQLRIRDAATLRRHIDNAFCELQEQRGDDE